METLTVKQCEKAQIRNTNSYGDSWPYKGYNYEHTEIGEPTPELPDGWQYVYIPTWGIHIRKDNDLEYQADL